MFGYDFSFDQNSENSNAIIAERIQSGKDVLEFGPAYGRLTRFLKEAKNCVVDIVEMNAESGESAARYARYACIGVDEGNIEKDIWSEQLKGQTYDYIVFADVLEHLRSPETVLKKCYNLLRPNGAIICSVPNIAHASVIISLLNNDFPYNTTGLLDRTHISFFTNKTFRAMCKNCHYDVVYEHAIYSKVGTNEIPYHYGNVPDAVENVLRFTENAEAYQYVFELRKENEALEAVCLTNTVAQSGWNVCCFVKEKEDIDFTPHRRICKKILNQQVDVTFDLREFNQITSLQINLIDCPAIVKLEGVLVGDIDGSETKRNDFDMSGARYGTQVWNVSEEEPRLFLQVKPTTSYVRVLYKIIAWNEKVVSDVAQVISPLYETWVQQEKMLQGKTEQLCQAKEQLCQEKEQLCQEKEQLQCLYEQLKKEKDLLTIELSEERLKVVELQKRESSRDIFARLKSGLKK